ncbi:MAG: hypothetical protein R3D33_16345 [Hyphomicrobiaceae bacterium]
MTSTKANETATTPAEAEVSVDLSRRDSLKSIGRFAAATAPAMLVLLSAPQADAGNCNDDGPGNNGIGNAFGHNKHSPV